MKIERNKNYIYYRIVLTHILTVIALTQKNRSLLTVFIVWIISAVIPNFVLSFTKNLKTIEIAENNICLTFSKYFKEVVEKYEYENLKFTYKIETGGRGSKSREFRMYKNDIEKSIVSVGSIFDGWTDDKLTEVTLELRKKGITVTEF